jgi:hypothetical protein
MPDNKNKMHMFLELRGVNDQIQINNVFPMAAYKRRWRFSFFFA